MWKHTYPYTLTNVYVWSKYFANEQSYTTWSLAGNPVCYPGKKKPNWLHNVLGLQREETYVSEENMLQREENYR